MTLCHRQEVEPGVNDVITELKPDVVSRAGMEGGSLENGTQEQGEEEEIDVVLESEDTGGEQLIKPAPAPPGASGPSSRRSGDVRSLLHFVSVAGGDIKAALDKSAPCKRSVDHRKYLQKQLCRLTSPAGGSNHQHLQPHLHALHHCPGTTPGGGGSLLTPTAPPPANSSPPGQPCSPTYSLSPPGGTTQSAEQLASRRSAVVEADGESSTSARGELRPTLPPHTQVSSSQEQETIDSEGLTELSPAHQQSDYHTDRGVAEGALFVVPKSPLSNNQNSAVFSNELRDRQEKDIHQGGTCYTGLFIHGPISALAEPVSHSDGGRSTPSSPAGQCMASPPAAPPAASVASPRLSPTSSVSSASPSPPTALAAPTTMVVATSGLEATDSFGPKPRDDSATSGPDFGLLLPPEVADDRDPLFEVPGVVDPTRGKKEEKDGASLQKSSIPLRQRQLPASFWKEPRPEERRVARPHTLETADLLAHGAFFMPQPPGVGAKSHTYDSYKAMADLYGARYQGLIGEAHRAAAATGLASPDYLLSAYASKVPTLAGVSSDPAALSVVATAAAYHSGGLYPWPYSLLPGEAEKALAARLQGSHPGVQPQHPHHHPHHHHHHQHQHHSQQHHQQQHPLLPASTPTSVGSHVVHGHSLLYHHRQAGLGCGHGSRSSSSVASPPGPAVGSPPGGLHGPCSSPPRPVLWDPLTALSAQSLLRQPPVAAANLWRPIPTKTLSAYQSRFHPFADVH